jgi:hypothetical protein
MQSMSDVMIRKIDQIWSRGPLSKVPYILSSVDDEAASMYGLSVKAIANEFSLHETTVLRRLKELKRIGKVYSYKPLKSPTVWWPMGGLFLLKNIQ